MKILKILNLYLKILIGIYVVRFIFYLYVHLDDLRFREYTNKETLFGEVALLMVNIIPVVILIIKIHKVNVSEFTKDYLIFRPNFLKEIHLLIRRLFSILSNFIILLYLTLSTGLVGIIIIEDGFRFLKYHNYWESISVMFGITVIYISLWLLVGIIFWLASSFKEQNAS